MQTVFQIIEKAPCLIMSIAPSNESGCLHVVKYSVIVQIVHVTKRWNGVYEFNCNDQRAS